MTDAERDPHVLISARACEHPKIIELPSDKARWGWVVLMGKAKLQRPPGRFASMRVLQAVLGDYRRFVDDYLSVGILERDGEAVVIHDWQQHQRSRVQQWRDEKGVPNGHGNLSGNGGETTGETQGKHYARAGALSQSQSLSLSPSGEGVQGEGDDDGRADLEAFLAVRFRAPTARQREFMDAYVRVFDVSGPQRGAALIYQHPDDPIGALKADLEAFRKQRAEEAQQAERPKPKRRRGPSTFTGVNAELAAMFASRYADDDRKYQHNLGQHADPDPECPLCRSSS